MMKQRFKEKVIGIFVNTKTPIIFLFSIYLICALISIQDPTHEKIWEPFPDTRNYVDQSNNSILSAEFWFPVNSPTLVPRPFTVPLLYKLVGGEPENIIVLQKAVHFLAGLLLSLSILLFINTALIKYLTGLALLPVFVWWNILGWSQQLLSESLSFSLLVIWLSTFLFYMRYRGIAYLITHLIFLVLLAFSRDSWPMALIFFYGVHGLFDFLFNRRLVKATSLMFLCAVLAFFIQQYAVQRGERHKIPVLNNIAVRILEHDSYLQFFTERGMPLADTLKKELAGIDLRDHNNREHLYKIYNSERYLPLHNWLAQNGRAHTWPFWPPIPPIFFY